MSHTPCRGHAASITRSAAGTVDEEERASFRASLDASLPVEAQTCIFRVLSNQPSGVANRATEAELKAFADTDHDSCSAANTQPFTSQFVASD
jgi:hypothetical protein